VTGSYAIAEAGDKEMAWPWRLYCQKISPSPQGWSIRCGYCSILILKDAKLDGHVL